MVTYKERLVLCGPEAREVYTVQEPDFVIRRRRRLLIRSPMSPEFWVELPVETPGKCQVR